MAETRDTSRLLHVSGRFLSGWLIMAAWLAYICLPRPSALLARFVPVCKPKDRNPAVTMAADRILGSGLSTHGLTQGPMPPSSPAGKLAAGHAPQSPRHTPPATPTRQLAPVELQLHSHPAGVGSPARSVTPVKVVGAPFRSPAAPSPLFTGTTGHTLHATPGPSRLQPSAAMAAMVAQPPDRGSGSLGSTRVKSGWHGMWLDVVMDVLGTAILAGPAVSLTGGSVAVWILARAAWCAVLRSGCVAQRGNEVLPSRSWQLMCSTVLPCCCGLLPYAVAHPWRAGSWACNGLRLTTGGQTAAACVLVLGLPAVYVGMHARRGNV